MPQSGHSTSVPFWTMFVHKEAIRKLLRPVIILVIAVLLFFFSDTSLWIAGLLLALFYFGVDVFNIDKSDSSVSTYAELYPAHETGVLGRYEIDSTQSYGLFVSLGGKPVFVDIREDKLIDKRKEFARYLSDNANELEKNLNEFIAEHPEYSSRQIASIGLHSKVLDQGEVFWEPKGYTGLKGMVFVD